MNKKTKGILAGAAGIALLTGGTTFATWSDQAAQDGGSITSGNLDVAAIGTPVWYDVSPDRADGAPLTGVLDAYDGHPVTAASWRIVPGDTAVAAFGFAVALQGDNLAASIDFSEVEALEGVGATISYEVFDKAGVQVAPDSDDEVRLRAADAAADLGGLRVERTQLTGAETTADLTVVVKVAFPADITDAVAAQAAVADLDDLGVSLGQDRAGEGF